MGLADAGYNMSYVFELSTSLHIPSLKAALSELVARHEILRTVFLSEGDSVSQVVLPYLDLNLPVLVFETREALEQAMHEGLRTDFDLDTGPLMRVAVFQSKEGKSANLIQFVMHHIIFDGWSGEIMQRELLALYSRQLQPSEHLAAEPLAPLPIQYGDYALWQRNQSMEKERDYWRRALADYDSSLQIPQDFFPENSQSQEVGFCFHAYSSAFSQALGQFNQQHTDIIDRRENEFLKILGLFAGFALIFQLAEFGHAIDQFRNVGAELSFNLREVDIIAVFDGVVKQARHNGGFVQAD
mgnify:CR=1 FL=1